jgi:curved DNA-binding protein CbpA
MLITPRALSRSTMDYYVVLGIPEDADEDTIRRAFRALARRYHPDVGAGSSPVEFQLAREAYETLADPQRRRRYDRERRASGDETAVVEELLVARPFAEPLFSSRRGAFDTPTAVRLSSFFEDILEELFGLLHDESHRTRRWR